MSDPVHPSILPPLALPIPSRQAQFGKNQQRHLNFLYLCALGCRTALPAFLKHPTYSLANFYVVPITPSLSQGKCWFRALSQLLCGHECNKNSKVFEFYSSQKQDPQHFDCPSFSQLQCEIQGSPRTFFYPQKGLNSPTVKGLRFLTQNAMGTWPRKAEGHCIIQLPIDWRQYI